MENTKMIDIRDIMKELQGELTEAAFARQIGVASTTIYWIYDGTRRVGRPIVARLIELFPDHRDDLMEAFFAQGGRALESAT